MAACSLHSAKGEDAMSSNAHYNRARHRAWAAKVLRRAGYLCEVCRRYGRLDQNGLPVAATVAHDFGMFSPFFTCSPFIISKVNASSHTISAYHRPICFLIF